MASILVVCTGNICRSPAAEGFLLRSLGQRLGADAPEVASAGTAGWDGSGATEESVRACSERGVDIGTHRARVLNAGQIAGADLIITMAREHTETVRAIDPAATDRTFTLKGLVRLLEATPSATPGLAAGVRTAADARASGSEGDPHDEDVEDPLGMSLDTYRAMAWELEEWTGRLANALFGPVPAKEGA